MLASDYVETNVSEMNPRCGNFVSCWWGFDKHTQDLRLQENTVLTEVL